MSVDFDAIAAAIAVRFGPTIISAPAGEVNVTQSTAVLPATISDEPVVLVFPPAVDFNYGPSLRKAVATYPVRFYLYKPVRDTPRNSTLLNNWLSALYDQLDGQVHLGLSAYVTHAVVGHIEVGELEYAEIKFLGIETTVTVYIQEGLSAVA